MNEVRGEASKLLEDAEQGRLAKALAKVVYGKRRPNRSEVNSWQESLPALLRLLVNAGLGHVEVVLEHSLPYSPKRIDALVCGKHPDTGNNSYVLVELKQWSKAEAIADGLVRVPGLKQPSLPPVAQVRRYQQHLLDFTPSLARQGELPKAVVYLHNADRNAISDLYNYESHGLVDLYARDEADALVERLRSALSTDPRSRDAASAAADELLGATIAPGRKLMETVATSFEERPAFVLLDEQQVAYNLVTNAVAQAERATAVSRRERKTVVVVRGGPGSGKSAIATTLLTTLARRHKRVMHATGSKAFTETLREQVAQANPRHVNVFAYFNTVVGRQDELDVRPLREGDKSSRGQIASNDQQNRWKAQAQLRPLVH
ncbi:DUF2075 domain-containing protein [Saccharopolyspora sp. TS4A08]|uniref:DUF2075 domain-containing protein n=1 Tax=Saccharopolyspora ipomoeae TaxID=3042027 RepID=A0ABT6PWF2_9PSEU|nr:DNA/RNA helicase domain-containing protein [Saccharopolyspora sp. TS4A08]MDI2032286.1 DUF2075 domain-containing protein [Saccharopolyspora sp. TS4A08]